MTGNLLQADIDLARRLLDSGQSDEHVVETLCLRRVDPSKARKAVQELKDGWDVRGEDLDDPEAFAAFVQPVQIAPPEPDRVREREPIAHSSPRGGRSWVWVTALVICAGLAGVWLWKNQQPRIHAASRQVADSPQPKLNLSIPAPLLRQHATTIQIAGGKVSLGGSELNSREAFARLNELMGAPTRTNRLEGSVLYTYDDHGIVLYSSENSGKDSLVIYLEAMGGTNGVQRAFSGTVMVDGRLIIAATDRNELSTVPNLGLKETVTNVFAGECGGLGINFAYLKSADRLTMVQVDLN